LQLEKDQIDNFGNVEAGIEDYKNMSLFNKKLEEKIKAGLGFEEEKL